MNYRNLKKDNGVFLYKDNSFHTITYNLNFVAPKDKKYDPACDLLEIYMSTLGGFESELDFAKECKRLYDSRFSTSISEVRGERVLTINADVVAFSEVEDYSKEFYELFRKFIFEQKFTDEDLLTRIKRQFVATISQSLEDTETLAETLLDQYKNGKTDADYEYSSDIEFIEREINKVTLDDLNKVYREAISNFHDGLVIGKISDTEYHTFREMFNLTSEETRFKAKRRTKDRLNFNKEVKDDETSESTIYVNYEIGTMTREQYELLFYILNSSCGIMHEILREKYGLVYSSYVDFSNSTNTFSIVANIDSKNKERLLEAANEVIELIQSNDKINELLEYAKNEIRREIYLLDEDKTVLTKTLDAYIERGSLRKDTLLKKIDTITADDITTLTKTLTKKGTFMYRGTKNE